MPEKHPSGARAATPTLEPPVPHDAPRPEALSAVEHWQRRLDRARATAPRDRE
jgi:hypothetical protein